ncbi:MAG: PQQ-binding-like beta-propeller repeat protein [Planctomycetota bacterium]
MKVNHASCELGSWLLFVVACCLPGFAGEELAAAGGKGAATDELAARLLETAQFQGGLVAHVGCGDGRLTADLHKAGASLVHGLDGSEQSVTQARHYIATRGCYGRVSVAYWPGERLPYAGGILDLLIVDGTDLVSRSEAMRVLAPGGVVLQRDGRRWRREEKSLPRATDDWTHYLHGPSNNAVSQDRLVGPPESIRWIGDFRHLRHHNYLSSLSAMVSAGGRLFTIEDQGSRMSMDLPPRWRLVARNAFNGVVLWEKSLESWANAKRGFRSGPLDVSRRLVATADRVFVTLGHQSPVQALDAATGELRRTYEQTEGAEEILFEDGVLYLVVSKPNPKSKQSRKKLLAVDANSGELKWETSEKRVENIMAQTLTLGEKRVFLHNGQAVLGLDREAGTVLWEAEVDSIERRPSWSAPTLVHYDGVVLCGDRAPEYPAEWARNQTVNQWMTRHGGPAQVQAFSAEDGSSLWTEAAAENFHAPVNVFVIDGLVWFGQSHVWWFGEAVRPTLSELGEDWYKEEPLLGRDPHTGEVKREVYAGEVFTASHHHRCYRGKATERFMLMGRTGVEFIDVEGNAHRRQNWIRGACQYGIMPANGLLYLPPHPCICYIESKLNGFYAVSAEGVTPEPDTDVAQRLFKGQAYGGQNTSEEGSAEWPTFRANAARGGFSPARIPEALEAQWKHGFGGRVSSPVVGRQRVFVAAIDQHAVHALDLDGGERIWSFTAGGRIDSPPTYWRDRVYFGSADGFIYCLDAQDGQLAWRFQAAPRNRLIPAHGQLESAWPVPGSVLVKNGVLYCMAGRSSYIDGGMYFVKLDAVTGEPLLVKNKFHRDPETGKQPPERGWEFGNNALELPGLLHDILSSQGDSLFLRQVHLSQTGKRRPEYATHLFNPHGFLSDSWWHRSYTIYGKRFYSGPFVWPDAGKKWPAGRVLVFDDQSVYGFGRKNPRGVGNRGYRLFAAPKETNDDNWKPTWEAKIPILGYAMALTNPLEKEGQQVAERLLVAGPPEEALRSLEAHQGRQGSELLMLDPADGTITSRMPIDSVPVQDGICAANGTIILALRNGTVLALAGK